MTALADPTRSRLLLALERNELTVNELRSVLQLPQSTISRHLKMLSAEGVHELVRSEWDGAAQLIRIDFLNCGCIEPRLVVLIPRPPEICIEFLVCNRLFGLFVAKYDALA